MPASRPFDQIAERVERLLVRHEAVERTNALRLAQLEAMTQERDALRSRLGAAASRVEALLARLPATPGPGPSDAAAGTAPEGTAPASTNPTEKAGR